MTMTDTIAQRPATGGPFETEAQAHEYARSVVGLLAHTPIVSANRHVLGSGTKIVNW